MLKPNAPHLIQHLGVIYLHFAEAQHGSFDWPGPDFEYDPSSSGDPGSWGTGTIGTDPDTGDPITGTSLGTRAPGGPDGTPPKRRKGGTGHPPSKNTLTRTDAAPGPHQCFVGFLKVRIVKPAPDPFGWDGQQLTLLGHLCAPYNPPAIPGPSTAFVTRSSVDGPLGFGDHTTAGTLLPDVVAQFLTGNVGSDSTAVVIEDKYDGPAGACTAGLAGSIGCGGSISGSSPNGSSVNAVISPA